MIYHAGNMVLSGVRQVYSGSGNDVVVCRELDSAVPNWYTLLIAKDRACARLLLSVFGEDGTGGRAVGEPAYLSRFTQNELLCFLFPYRPERRLGAFGPGQMTSAYMRERVCVNLLMECMSSTLPYPLLYLVLTQEQIHIEKDNSVYFTACFDLAELNAQISEADCVKECARILLSLLESGTRKRLRSYELIRKKAERGAYQAFPQLYMDLRFTEIPENRVGLRQQLRERWRGAKDPLFRVLLALSVAAVCVALVCLVSQLIFGDIPLLRIFEHSFDVIGTQSLK